MVTKYRLSTLGCKVNQYESQQIRELLESLGLRQASPRQSADIAIVNTCAVTTTALAKSRRAVRRLTNDGRTPVVVVGCGVSARDESLCSIRGVLDTVSHDADMLAGLRSLIAQWMERTRLNRADNLEHTTGAQSECPRAYRYEVNMSAIEPAPAKPPNTEQPVNALTSIITPGSPAVKKEPLLTGQIRHFTDHERAFLKVQDGCDAHCTYCIIPRLRPLLRSKPREIAVSEAQDLVRSGHREIVVTGIFLGAYGRDTAARGRLDADDSPLAELVEDLAKIPGLERIRLSSLEPGDVDDALLTVLDEHHCCVPHLHLPLQSGSPDVLRRMNRQYTRDQYLRMIDRVRSRLDEPAITTDLIVGFPKETESDFKASLETARFAQFSKIHVFPFSPRPGTAAAGWKRDFVPRDVVKERVNRIEQLGRRLSFAFRKRLIGRIERVIIEGDSPTESAPSRRHGRTDRYFDLDFEGGDASTGQIVSVRIDRVTVTGTHGTRVSPDTD